jgi:ubiquinone/menaquinone biosynthesis C-methylase UbiE/DNA-binding transcriptional ArsR family regulator
MAATQHLGAATPSSRVFVFMFGEVPDAVKSSYVHSLQVHLLQGLRTQSLVAAIVMWAYSETRVRESWCQRYRRLPFPVRPCVIAKARRVLQRPPSVNASWDILKTLSDPTRLRLLALVLREELSVAELQEILGMGQSRISSQLALLRQVNLVTDRREGKKAFYSLRGNLSAHTLALLKAAVDSVGELPVVAEDRENLDRILQKRRRTQEQYFNLIAGRLGKNYCPGRSWEAIGHLALRLTPAIDIADLGAGEGLVSQLLAQRARSVWCIDNSPRMVEVGAELARKNGLANLTYKLGDIEEVPLADKSVDLAILSQALHHAQHPQAAVNEAYRILRPGGQLLILDLNEHTFEKARELYADVWLGFKESTLHGFLKKSGFTKAEVTTVAKEPGEPFFETLLASGIKSARLP